MQFRCCHSPACGRPFQVNQYKPRTAHSFDTGKITCPHCGTHIDADSKSVYLTHAMSAKEEAEFNTGRARRHSGSNSAEHAREQHDGDHARHTAGSAGRHPSEQPLQSGATHPDAPQRARRGGDKAGSPSGDSRSC